MTRDQIALKLAVAGIPTTKQMTDLVVEIVSIVKAEVFEELASSYEGVLADKRKLTRELDVLLNGDGAAKQASLCDIVAQVRREGVRSDNYLPKKVVLPSMSQCLNRAKSINKNRSDVNAMCIPGWVEE